MNYSEEEQEWKEGVTPQDRTEFGVEILVLQRLCRSLYVLELTEGAGPSSVVERSPSITRPGFHPQLCRGKNKTP